MSRTARLALALPFLALLAAAPARAYEPPRTPDGRPDLQGIWTNASITRLTRPEGVKKLVLTPQEAAIFERTSRYNVAKARDAQASDPNEGAPTDGNTDAGYNAFWIDPGSKAGLVKGEYRTSWIVDPPDGQIPRGAGARKVIAAMIGNRRNYDGPETRPVGERCLIGFGGTGGPGMLNVLYNNTYQIVQTGDHVMILVEMVHDARIVRMGGEHLPPAITPWLGDSVGHWDGDTLVVETTQVNPVQGRQGFILLTPKGKVTERFTRYSDDQIFYSFTVEDPELYTRPWTAEMSFNATKGPVYEYACHEGNYALPGVLEGARAEEKKQASAKP
ncbi:MAG: hypothetical protein H6923_01140 [Alphaproteobacteria bacterium]|nr:hypothetical protein [Alphaproteobacteria bacterium]